MIRIVTREEGEWIVVEISDNGPGFSEETRARALEPFYTTKPRGEGTGLGLAICQRLGAGMSGELHLGSSPEGGAMVGVRLRRA